MIDAAGGMALRLPLLAIAPVPDPSAAARRLESGRNADRWIFSSTNAVQETAALVAPPWPPAAAVGSVTAATLQALGHSDVLTPPQRDGANALLAHPAFADIGNQRLVLIAGENPLPELETELRRRGAQVEVVAVYRRVAVAHAPAAVADAVKRADIAVVPGVEALTQLLRLTPPAARARLLHLQLAVPSPRVVEKALELGFTRTPLLPQRVTDAAYLDVLRLYCKRRLLIAHD